MIGYRKSKISDSCKIARIHLKSFPDFFLTTLGYSFLKTYYRSCVKSKEAISICAIKQDDKKLVGFAVGSYNSEGFNKRLIFSNLLEFSYRSIFLLFTKPLALIRLYKNLTKKINKDDKGDYAELFSIGVCPEQNGLGIGQQLLHRFENLVREKGVNTVTLTTDTENNDRVLRFYKKSGYAHYYDFLTYPNRKMVKLIKELK